MKFKRGSEGHGFLIELSPGEAQLPDDGEAGKPIAVFTLKKILVPVDFSECSNKALQYAIPLAKQFGAEITLIHAFGHPFELAEVAMAEAAAIQAAREELNRLVHRTIDCITARGILRIGNPWNEIVDAAKETAADLIIISTHGRSGLAHVFLGSTAERVVRHAPCPVLVVREREHEFVNSATKAD